MVVRYTKKHNTNLFIYLNWSKTPLETERLQQCSLSSNMLKRTLVINPQSHSFSQSCGTVLPTSLTYLFPSARSY